MTSLRKMERVVHRTCFWAENLLSSSSCSSKVFQTRLKFTLKLLEAVTKTKTKFSEFLSNTLRLTIIKQLTIYRTPNFLNCPIFVEVMNACRVACFLTHGVCTSRLCVCFVS